MKKLKITVLSLFVLCVIYLLSGYFLLPYIVKEKLPSYSQETFNTSISVEKVTFNPLTLELTIQNLHLPDNHNQTLLNVGNVYANIDVNTLFDKVLLVRSLEINHVEINIQKISNRQTNFSQLLETLDSEQPKDKDASLPWNILIEDFALNTLRLNFNDLSLSKPVHSHIDIVSLNSNNVTTRPNTPFDYQLVAQVENGTLNSHGRISLSPVVVMSHIDLIQIPIVTYSPYLSLFSTTSLTDGSLSITGDLNMDLTNEKPHILFRGESTLSDINLLDQRNQQAILSWDNIMANGIDFSSTEQTLHISNIDISTLNTQIVFNQASELNLQTILTQTSDVETDGEPLSINIDKVNLKNNRIQFSDLSLPKPFYLSIEHLNGEISNYSTKPNTLLTTKIEGNTNKGGYLKILGKLNPSKPMFNSDIQATLRDASMANMTPYTVKFIGQKINSGKLNIAFDYKLRERLIKGSNDIRFDRVELGDSVDNPDTIKLPLSLALALLEDSQGQANIDLPVSGDTNNPDFSYSHLISRAFGGVITGIITAPFKFLGKLLGTEDEKLESIGFALANAQLLRQEQSKLRTIVKALQKRPSLTLGIHPVYNIERDTHALREKQLTTLLVNNKQELIKKEPWNDVPNAYKVLRYTHEKHFGIQDSQARIEKIESKNRALAQQTKHLRISDALHDELYHAIIIDQQVLSGLASKRAQAIYQFLLSQNLSPKRLKLLEEQQVEAKENNWIESKLSLDALVGN